MKFESHGRKYAVDRYGVIHQIDAKPFVYDENYCATYDTPEYRQQSDILQALRLAFCLGAHGTMINSILDCGYGNGAFMRFVKHHVPFVYGLDVTGIQVDNCYIMPEFVKADVVTFWDALEHVPDLSFVRHLHAETVVISLPYCHFLTLGLAWFDTWHHRKPDEHLHHFNEFSLANFMQHNGWQAVAVSHHEDIVRVRGVQAPNILSMAFRRK